MNGHFSGKCTFNPDPSKQANEVSFSMKSDAGQGYIFL